MDGQSAPPLERLEALLEHHVGRRARIGAAAIARELGCDAASVPGMVCALRLHGIAVCGDAERGYFIAADPRELGEMCRFAHEAALRALLVEARLSGVPLAALAAQLLVEIARGARELPRLH